MIRGGSQFSTAESASLSRFQHFTPVSRSETGNQI
jgi:hypothetical protein